MHIPTTANKFPVNNDKSVDDCSGIVSCPKVVGSNQHLSLKLIENRSLKCHDVNEKCGKKAIHLSDLESFENKTQLIGLNLNFKSVSLRSSWLLFNKWVFPN